MRLLTERLELRPLPVAAARALAGDRAAAARLLGAALASEWPQPDLLAVLPRQRAGRERFGVWIAVERETGTVIGDAGFHGPPDEEGTVELGYAIVPERRRRGYATEAARALVEWVLAEPGIAAVVAGCKPDNVASIRTLERLGFTRAREHEGELRWRLVRPQRASG
jgi:ribosomal-protein-alanine N-acetyltransferase